VPRSSVGELPGEYINNRKYFIVVALGSAGDVYPFLGIAKGLAQRGHTVTFLSNSFFEGSVRHAGLPFHSIGSIEDYDQTVGDPLLWSPSEGFSVMWRKYCEPAMAPTYEFIRDAGPQENCTVIASPMAFGAHLAQEALGIRLIIGYLSPSNLRTHYGRFEVAGVNIPQWTPRWVRRGIWRFIDNHVLDPLVCPSLNALRKTLGLQPIQHVFARWFNQSQMALTLFPKWFAAPQSDWPQQLRYGDFPLYDNGIAQPMPSKLLEFLDEGDPPIVFCPGSAMRHANDFFRVSLESCLALGRRAVFLSAYRTQVPRSLPHSVRHFDFAPFGQLLHRSALFVHHGGIGSCAQAMQAGVPQLIMPMAHDQFHNAARIENLGLGYGIPRKQYITPMVSQKMRALLDSIQIRQRNIEIANQFRTIDPISRLCDLIEENGNSPSNKKH
jgi:rhamnosyltransferase subunit B